jgi:hypothetical protein
LQNHQSEDWKGSNMRSLSSITAVLGFVVAFTGGQALANVCQTDHMACATTMPIDGYCQCTSRGGTEDGTVILKPVSHQSINARAGGCGAEPGAPGCKH